MSLAQLILGRTIRVGVSVPAPRSSVVAKATTPYQLLDSDCLGNRTFTNEGATGTVVLTLPSAKAGRRVRLIVQAAFTFRATAKAGDTIRVGASVSAAAGNVAAATVGNVIDLLAINATEWIEVGIVGSWTLT